MDLTQKDKKLLGNKRKNDSETSDDEKRENSSDNEKNYKSKSEPSKLFKNTLFGSKDNKELGLLGDLSEKESDKDASELSEKEEKPKTRKKAKKKEPLFQNGENNAFNNSKLFSGGSLFGSSLSNTLASSSLFSGSSLFANSSLFRNETKKKDEDESGDENDDNNEDEILKPSNSPRAYDPTNNENKSDVKSIYTKKYVKEIESFYELVREEKTEEKADEKNTENKEEKKPEFINKYVNKGKGFLSLEYTEEGGKAAIIVYRNGVGNIITDGILNHKIKKFDRYIKNLKHVAQFSYMKKNSQTNKLELGMAKIPFMREDDLKELEAAYNNVLDLIKTE